MACNRCGTTRKPTKDFCGSINISTRVKLSGCSVLIEKEGAWVDAKTAIVACPTTPGTQLLKVVIMAASKASGSSVIATRNNKIMPLILLKSFLFGIVGTCKDCKGKGCPYCKNLGV